MTRVAELYQNTTRPVLSFEFFPPRNEKAEASFGQLTDNFISLKPDYMSVTFGAGGSTRDGSYQTVKTLVDKSCPTVAYIAGFGLGPGEIKDVLDKYQVLGIKTIFVIRGDQPGNSDFSPHPESFGYASEMIEFIKKNYNFTLGCAGYPEGHIQSESLDKDIEFLKRKVDNGAEYIVCQYCYDNDRFKQFMDKCTNAGINVPIVPGIMPVYTVKLTQNLAKVCGAALPHALETKLKELETAEKDDVLNFGIDFAVEQSRELLKYGVPGLHFYTMDRSKSSTEIVNRLRGENLL